MNNPRKPNAVQPDLVTLPVSTSPTHSPVKDTNPRNENIPPLFTVQHLRLIFSGAAVIILLVVVFTYKTPTYLEHEPIRVIICILLALCISFLFFIFWPEKLKMNSIPIINLPVSVTGPIVLWLCVLPLLLHIIPSTGNHWGFYKPARASAYIPYHGTDIKGGNGEDLTYYIVENRKEKGHLEGVCVNFAPGKDSIEAYLKIPGYKSHKIIFLRSQATFDLSGLTREDKQ